jgi:hypothetical protein
MSVNNTPGINPYAQGQYPAHNPSAQNNNSFQFAPVINGIRPSTPEFTEALASYVDNVTKENQNYHLNLGKIPGNGHYYPDVYAKYNSTSVRVAPIGELANPSNGYVVERAGPNSFNVRYYGQTFDNNAALARNAVNFMGDVSRANRSKLYADPTYPLATPAPPPQQANHYARPPSPPNPYARPVQPQPNPYARPPLPQPNPYARPPSPQPNPYARPPSPALQPGAVLTQAEIAKQLYQEHMWDDPNDLPIFPVTFPGQPPTDYVAGRNAHAIQMQQGSDWRNKIPSGLRFPKLGGDVTYNGFAMNNLSPESRRRAHIVATAAARRFGHP